MEGSAEILEIGDGRDGSERRLSECELSITRSLQKLDLPEWYKNSPLSRHGSREKIIGLHKKQLRWDEFRQKSTSTSSLPVTRRFSTSTSSIGRRIHAPGYNTPSPSTVASSPFSRRNSKDGSVFQYSTPPVSSMVSSRCTSPFTSLGGYNYTRPYTGWRSSERLARECALADEEDSASMDASFANSSSFYWSPEERLSYGPGYFAMKFGVHPGIFARNRSASIHSGNIDEQLSNLMSPNYFQNQDPRAMSTSQTSAVSDDVVVGSETNDDTKMLSFVSEIDKLIAERCQVTADDDQEANRFKPSVVAVTPKFSPAEISSSETNRFLGGAEPMTVEMKRKSPLMSFTGPKLVRPWPNEIGKATFPVLFNQDLEAPNRRLANDVIIDDKGSQTDGEDVRFPLSSSSPIPSVNTASKPIIYDLSMVDSETAAAFGLPVLNSRESIYKNQHLTHIKNGGNLMNSNKSSELLSFAFASLSRDGNNTKSPSYHAAGSSTRESEIIDDDKSESDEESVESLPKFTASPLPRATTTTVTRSNGRITEIVEVATDDTSKATLRPDMLKPLAMSLSIISTPVTPNSEPSTGFSSYSSASHHNVTPLTTTTFITTFHRDKTTSPSQPPPELESFSGKTRTITLLNEDAVSAETTQNKFGMSAREQFFNNNRAVTSLNIIETQKILKDSRNVGLEGELCLENEELSVPLEMEPYSGKNKTITLLNEDTVSAETTQNKFGNSAKEQFFNSNRVVTSVNIIETQKLLKDSRNVGPEGELCLENEELSVPPLIVPVEKEAQEPIIYSFKDFDVMEEEVLAASPKLQELLLNKSKNQIEMAGNEMTLSDDAKSREIPIQKAETGSMEAKSLAMNSSEKFVSKSKLLIDNNSNAQNGSPQTSSSMTSPTSPLSSPPSQSSPLQSPSSLNSMQLSSNYPASPLTSQLSSEQSPYPSSSKMEVFTSDAHSTATENYSVNQSIDSWVTAQSTGNLNSQDTSMDMSLGTIVHRIGFTPRGRRLTSSFDDTNSVFSSSTDFDTVSIIRMRSFDEQRKANRRSVRSSDLDESVIVKCARDSCKQSAELKDARVNFKTCHNCDTFYCSNHCRKNHKERHRCPQSKSRHVCKLALNYAKENEDVIEKVSKVAREGLRKQGKGYVRVTLPNAKAGVKFIRHGVEKLEIPIQYYTCDEINQEELGDEVCTLLLDLCSSYDPAVKVILLVTMFVNKEITVGGTPHWEKNIIAKCAKIRLSKLEPGESDTFRRPRSRRNSNASSVGSRRSWRWSLA